MELQHRPSQCDKCGYGTGSALTLSVSQDRAMSELVARLHAAEVAAEVEGLQPNRLLLTDSGSSSDKSAAGVTGRKVESPAEQPIAATDFANPVPQHTQETSSHRDPAIAQKVRRSSNVRNTKALTGASAITLPLDQSTPISKSRFYEDVPTAAKSTPTLTRTPGYIPSPFVERSSAATTAAQLSTTPVAALPTNPKYHAKQKPRLRFRQFARAHWGWMGLRKKSKVNDREQWSEGVLVPKKHQVR